MLGKYVKRELKLGFLVIPWPLVNFFRLRAMHNRRGLKIHVGCGEDALPGFVNIDSRLTSATNVTMDLSELDIFPPGTVDCFFSNAFLEHLYRNQRLPHLRSVCRALNPDMGFACYIGLPYFPNIAKFYLERAPGTAGPVFDLYNVYRYTHGDPEETPDWWLEQLHKSLFDDQELEGLLAAAGFESWAIFCYSFPGDYNEMPVSIGFYAMVSSKGAASIKEACLIFLGALGALQVKKIRLNSIEFLSRAGISTNSASSTHEGLRITAVHLYNDSPRDWIQITPGSSESHEDMATQSEWFAT